MSPNPPGVIELRQYTLHPGQRDTLRADDVCWLESEPTPNNFPRLPVREGEHTLVALSRGAATLPAALQPLPHQSPQTLRLVPTTHSPLR